VISLLPASETVALFNKGLASLQTSSMSPSKIGAVENFFTSNSSELSPTPTSPDQHSRHGCNLKQMLL